jgi:spermidine synthase
MLRIAAVGTSSVVRLPVSVVGVVAILSAQHGLGYEMVWTRLWGVALGTESHAVVGVVAALFVGLGLGGWSMKLVRSSVRPAPGRLYAVLELLIALWACACSQFMPALTRSLPGWLAAIPWDGAVMVLTFLVPALVLLPATVAMGGTLRGADALVRAPASGPARRGGALCGEYLRCRHRNRYWP